MKKKKLFYFSFFDKAPCSSLLRVQTRVRYKLLKNFPSTGFQLSLCLTIKVDKIFLIKNLFDFNEQLIELCGAALCESVWSCIFANATRYKQSPSACIQTRNSSHRKTFVKKLKLRLYKVNKNNFIWIASTRYQKATNIKPNYYSSYNLEKRAYQQQQGGVLTAYSHFSRISV